MLVKRLTLEGMRNLAPLALEPGPRFNVFSGQNGQGKTNLLEAIYVLCALRSFRTPRLTDLIRFGAEGARLAADIAKDDLERRYELVLSDNRRKVLLDGKAVRPLVRYFGGFNVVLFAPEDLQIPRGEPAPRERFLDRAVFGRMPSYMAEVQEFEKTLRSRNKLLKKLRDGDSRDDTLLDVFSEKLAKTGAKIVATRKRYVADMATRFSEAFERIMRMDKVARVAYQGGLAGTGEAELVPEFMAALTERLRRDRERGFTSMGPHRDDLLFTLDDKPAGSFASQGQLRGMVLAWKTAELALLESHLGHAPVFLLDDVSSELDPSRNQHLFTFLREQTYQCFITTTHPQHVLLEQPRMDYAVEGGQVVRKK